MKTFDFATATRLDLEIWDTQNKIKYIKLPTTFNKKRLGWTTVTKKYLTLLINNNHSIINTSRVQFNLKIFR